MVKIDPVDPEIICLTALYQRKKETTVCTSLPILNSGVTGPNVHQIYTQRSHIITDKILKSGWQYCNPFRNAGLYV